MHDRRWMVMAGVGLMLAGCTGPGPAPPRPAPTSKTTPPPAATSPSAAPPPATTAPAEKPAAAPQSGQRPVLGTNEKPADAGAANVVPGPPDDPATWKPAWWITGPTREAGVVSAAGSGEGTSVLEA